MLSRIKFEIDDLVVKLLDQLPDSYWSSNSTTFCDPAIGGGQVVRVIEQRLREYGHSDQNIRTRVFGYEESYLHIRYAVNKHNLIGQYQKLPYDQFLNTEHSMKFDVVIGNPPYLKGKWVEFLKQAVSLSNDRVLMISPDGTNNFSSRSESLIEFLKENGIQSKEECTNYFPSVESGKIVIYNLNVNDSYNPNAFIDNSVSGKIISKVIAFKGKKLSAILSSKRSKRWTSSQRFDTQVPNSIKNLESVTKEKPVYSWIMPENTTVIDASKYWLVNRYFGKDFEATIVETNEKIGISHNIMAIERINGWTVDEFKEVYLSKLFRFVLEVLRQGGFDTSPRHLKQLLVVKKTGKDLYSHFGFNQEEIEFIENAFK